MSETKTRRTLEEIANAAEYYANKADNAVHEFDFTEWSETIRHYAAELAELRRDVDRLKAKLQQGADRFANSLDLWGWYSDVRQMFGLDRHKETEPIPRCTKCKQLEAENARLAAVVEMVKTHYPVAFAFCEKQVVEVVKGGE